MTTDNWTQVLLKSGSGCTWFLLYPSTMKCDGFILVQLVGRNMAARAGPEGGLDKGKQVGGPQSQGGSHWCVQKRSRSSDGGGEPPSSGNLTQCFSPFYNVEELHLKSLSCFLDAGQLWNWFCCPKWEVSAAGEGRGLCHLGSPPEKGSQRSRICKGETLCSDVEGKLSVSSSQHLHL